MAEGLRVTVPGEARSYPVIVGWGVAAQAGQLLRQQGLEGRPLVMIDAGLEGLYGSMVSRALADDGGCEAPRYVVPAGEEHKTLAEVARAYTWLAAQKAERRDVVVAVGGGKTGDLAGFVAASYLRGLPLVQVPTTLLAQVDSSLGGKVGVDLPEGKNLVGAFHHPALVLADLAFLRSLPRRELAAGYAEVVKHGVIGDAGLFDLLEQAGSSLLDLAEQWMAVVVPRAMAVKIDVVQDDVHELGRRAILNYGHSVGHALEVVTNYRVLLHGEAVALGMVAAAALSQRLGLLRDRGLVRRQNDLLRALDLLVRPPAVAADDVIRALGYDKKVLGGRLRWVLPRAIGDPVVTAEVPPELVRGSVQDLLAGTLLDEG